MIYSCNEEVECPTWIRDLSFDLKPFYSCSVWLEDELNDLEKEEKETLLENLIVVKNVPSYDGNVYKEYFIKDGIL